MQGHNNVPKEQSKLTLGAKIVKTWHDKMFKKEKKRKIKENITKDKKNNNNKIK